MYECVQLLCCLIDVFFFGKLLDVSLSENLRNIFLTKIPARPGTVRDCAIGLITLSDYVLFVRGLRQVK